MNKVEAEIKSIQSVAGTVVLYNSEMSVYENIETYIQQISKLYVIDNSENINLPLINKLKQLSKVEYISNGGNKGIAYALNLAAELALENGYKYLLTMDDDSKLPSNAIISMLDFLKKSPLANEVGIISGVHSEPLSKNIYYRDVLYTMTSGNLLSLNIYQKIGPFRNDFFIDHVDHEYGCRLNSNGFKVIELSTLHINHRLGSLRPTGFMSKTFTSHTPVRCYYIVRNGWIFARLYWKKFPSVKWLVIKWISSECMKAILFEDQKIRRLNLLWQGLTDALHNRLGKFKEIT